MKEIITLDIGSHSIKLLGLKKTSRGPFLSHLAIKKIPKGIDQEDVRAISSILKLLMEDEGIKSKKIKLTLSSPGIQLRRMVMPSIPKNELTEAIKWEMKAYLPYPPEEATFRYHIIDQFTQDKAKKLDLLIVSCPSEIIEKILKISSDAGLEVEHLEVEAFSLWNALIFFEETKIGETLALLDFGAKKINLFIFKDGIIQFAREFTPGSDDLTRAIMEEIPSKEDLHLQFEAAERIKEEIGIPLDSPSIKEEIGPIDPSKLLFIIRPILERWISEINLSIEYYRTQFYGEHIDRMLICGGGSNLKNISSYLQRELRIPVKHFNPLSEILYDPKNVDSNLIEQMGSTFSTSFGASLSKPKEIDFLSPKLYFWERFPLDKIVSIGIPLITILIYILMIWQTETKLAKFERDQKDRMEKLKKLESMVFQFRQLKEKEEKIKRDLSILPSSIGKPIHYEEILIKISEMIPPNVSLTSLEITSETKNPKFELKSSKLKEAKSPDDEKRILYLSGLAFGNDIQVLSAISKVIEGLEQLPRFKNVKLLSTNENKSYNKFSAQFEIICDILPPMEPLQDKVP